MASSSTIKNDIKDLKKISDPLERARLARTRQAVRYAVENAPRTVAESLGKNSISGLSRLGLVDAAMLPAMLGAEYAFNRGAYLDESGQTQQMADEVNQYLKSGLVLDDNGNYRDAATGELIEDPSAYLPPSQPVADPEPSAEELEAISRAEAQAMDRWPGIYPVSQLNSELQALNALTNQELASRVIRGRYGNNPERARTLGTRYTPVQELVNEAMGRNR